MNNYAGIFWLMFVFPSEAVMPAVGLAAARGEIAAAPAFAAAHGGTVLSSVVAYWLCRLIRQATTEKFIARYGKLFGVSPSNLERAGRWFSRHAHTTVFAGRFIPALRSASSIIAGLARMPFQMFLLVVLTGSALDNAILGWLGYTAGSNFDALERFMQAFVFWSIPLVVTAILGFFWYKFRRKTG